MRKPIGLVFVICLLLTIFSCNEDEGIGGQMGIDSQSLFTIHAGEIQGFSGSRFVMASSPSTGEVFYSGVMTSFEDNITFNAQGSKTVDVTYAHEYNTGFNITTYRDVNSGFRLSGFLYPCYQDEYSFDALNYASVDIIISGTNEIVEIINPAYDNNADLEDSTTSATIDERNNIIYDFDNDVTIVKARLGSSSLDHQFVFRFEGEEDYKSIFIKREEWVKVDDDNYKLELEAEDLSSCNKYSIDVGIDNTWIVESEVLTTSGDRIAIAEWSNYSQNQEGESITLFLQDDLELEELFLRIRRSNVRDGYRFQRTFHDVPTSIALKEYDSELIDLTPATFNYATDENYDLVKTSYTYSNDNHISSWDIYQPSSSGTAYSLPEIDGEFLDGTDLMKSSLTNPNWFLIEFYSLASDVDHIYHETGINRQLPCLDFKSSYDSYEF